MNTFLGRLAGILLLAFALVACSKQTPSEPLRSAADDTLVEHALKHTSPKYRCPMHPDIVRDEPGECPICGMTLVKVEPPAGEAGTDKAPIDAEVRISPAVIFSKPAIIKISASRMRPTSAAASAATLSPLAACCRFVSMCSFLSVS